MGDVTEQVASRGAEAYRQACEYIASGRLYRTNRGRRRAAMRYLLLTASPALTAAEKAMADAAMRRQRAADNPYHRVRHAVHFRRHRESHASHCTCKGTGKLP